MDIVGHLIKKAVHTSLFQSMMSTLGLRNTLQELPDSPAVIARAVERCMGCEQVSACEDWLDSHSGAYEPPSYCKNGDLAARLAKLVDRHTELETAAEH
jgi:hypothetical protein